MNICSAADSVCQLLAMLNSIIDVKIAFIFTVSLYISWSMGYSQGRATINNKKNYYEGFINGIMFLMVKFKSKSNISFDILFEKDDFVTEAIRRIGTSKEYKTPNERGDQ